ncbi:MAG: polyphosphate--nucleotide phosphotransferase [Ramlibacter sp.]|nr:polyphosphate--nucleotide phosphotransferase [Ramlibacter sp.]
MAPKTKRPRRASRAALAPWQVATTGKAAAVLSKFDPAARPFSTGDKLRDKALIEELALEIDHLQDLLYADRRFRMLVVLQGMDASGKDGTIRHVFGRVSPLGVHTTSWRAPSDEERAHDFLWRIHQRVPGAGELMIFNRSHYEDVLVPVVNGELEPTQVAQRIRQINDFERLLVETGTVVLKFMLHIGPDEQRKRLQARVDDPAKAWKFVPADLEARRQWDRYQQAYGEALGATSTSLAPWTIVPADSKTHRNLMIATIVRDKLLSLGLRYPPPDPQVQGIKVV